MSEPNLREGAPPPQAVIMQLIAGRWIAHAMHAAASLDLADHLQEGPLTAPELAARCSAHPAALYRLLRALASVGIFTEVGPGRFANTPVSAVLGRDVGGSMRAAALYFNDPALLTAWGALPQAVRSGQCAFVAAHGEGSFPYMSQHAELAHVFAQAMTALSAQIGRAVAERYDFTSIHRLVDVGGGEGQLLAIVLAANPQLCGVLFDQPQVVGAAAEVLGQAGLSARCTILGGDFFQDVPRGADAYMLKHVLHDWPDEQALHILQNVKRAMVPGGRLLLIESIVGSDPAPDYAKLLDLEMLVVSGGRERTAAEFSTLLTTAGFSLTRVIATSTPACILEATCQ